MNQHRFTCGLLDLVKRHVTSSIKLVEEDLDTTIFRPQASLRRRVEDIVGKGREGTTYVSDGTLATRPYDRFENYVRERGLRVRRVFNRETSYLSVRRMVMAKNETAE
jgi:hypothetical protein